MTDNFILSRRHTQCAQGISALTIMAFHFFLNLDGVPRWVNLVGSVCVAAFLFLSGYGLNESYKQKGLEDYWLRRLKRVVLPVWVIYLAQIPFVENFSAEQLLRNLCFCASTLWFVDYILYWYIAYWIARRFLKSHTLPFLIAAAILCLPMEQLKCEQALSFVAGFWASEHRDRLQNWSKGLVWKYVILTFAYGTLFLLLKEIPAVHEYKGSFIYNIILLNIKLPMSFTIVAAPFLLPIISRSRFLAWAGRACYEIYIVHYNFIPLVSTMPHVIGYSTLSLALSGFYARFTAWMRKPGNLTKSLALLLFAGINYNLMLKYSMRFTPHYAALSLGYAIVLLLLPHLWLIRWKREKGIFWTLLVALCAAMLVLQYHIDPVTIQVDRWSAIANPLTALFHGQFPYSAQTHLGGYASPFPVWLVLHIPFWLMGNVGLSEILAIALFVGSIKMLHGWRSGILATIFIGSSICVWYEVTVRSDLATNFFLLAAFANCCVAKRYTFSRHPMMFSAFAGLWLSTRLNTAFPLFILYLPEWLKLNRKLQVGTILLAGLVFLATFAPLILWDASQFFGAEYPPFLLQTRQGYPGDAALFVLVATLLAWWTRQRGEENLTLHWRRQQMAIALILIFIVVVTFTHNMHLTNTWTEIYASRYDITYLNTALPTLIAILAMG